MRISLKWWLHKVPDEVLWKEGVVGGLADHGRVQARYIQEFYSGRTAHDYAADLLNKKVPNTSAFQRAISREAEERRLSLLKKAS